MFNNPDSADSAERNPFAASRLAMVEEQLRARGITDRRVLSAMGDVPREAFLPQYLKEAAYQDRALPIAHGQTISQPFTVAFMLQALELRGREKVLEVGTGSGYGAAVLSRLAREVHTSERIGDLAEQAQTRLEELGYDNVKVHLADGSLGLPAEAPFDAIVVTAAAEELPIGYQDQLVDGGRIVIPLGAKPTGQALYRLTKEGEALRSENLGPFAFVPLLTGLDAE